MSTSSLGPSDPRSLIRYGFLWLAITIVALWAAYLIRSQLLVIYVCVLFATGLSPLVRWIERRRTSGKRRLPRPAAILLIYATVIGLLVGIGFAVLPPLIEQSQAFWRELPDRIGAIQRRLVSWGLISPDTSYKDLLQQAPGSGDAVNFVLGTVWGFVGGLFGLVTILLLTFYLLVESQSIFNFFVKIFPRERRQTVADVSAMVTNKVSAWLGGQIFLGFIIGATTAIGLGLMGVPYFFVLALIAGIGEMVPMVGPLLSAIPAIAVAFTVSPGLALGVAIFFLVQQQLENAVLVPKLMGQTVGLSAVTVILSLLIGGSLLGFAGALLAVPTAAIIQVLFEELYLAEKDPA
ncbi:MAG TPA: AI-2E family transporter [Vicinamibacterales bacterium]